MTTLKIEKDVPVPEVITKRHKYPFAEMKKGDSFFVPDVPKTFSIYSLVRCFNEKRKEKIAVMQRREANGVRVWRVL